ncbi:hypothetical protein Nepgr_000663 [Nepenthes gracilis]|uniref:Uncharacterized protein n=1 Tax=Nepenthes gracilis TaxID=150966 RepID=A0AAD3P6T9_NEPGR|nr:hypothetical protein Nepgr_000663 [Nepenthes gracilis]
METEASTLHSSGEMTIPLIFNPMFDWFSEGCRRETGLIHPRSFTRRVSASEGHVTRLNLYGKLVGHEGCVNAVEFDSSGELLVSGSDDRQVMFWNWASKSRKLSYHSGHLNNIYQTKIMPFTDDQKIVTSAADGQVRLGQVLEGGHVDTEMLGKHEGGVFKLAVEPGSPFILYSCGLDGFVQHFDLRSNSTTKLVLFLVLRIQTLFKKNQLKVNRD